MTAPLPSDTVEQIGLAVMHLSEVVHRYRSVIARERYHLDPTAGMTIVALHLRGPMTPREIATAVNLTPPATTELLDRLEHSGYVLRRPHPTDRRKVLVSPTSAATALSRRESNDLARIIGPILGALPGPGRETGPAPDAEVDLDAEVDRAADGERLRQALLTLLTELTGRIETTSLQIVAESSRTDG